MLFQNALLRRFAASAAGLDLTIAVFAGATGYSDSNGWQRS